MSSKYTWSELYGVLYFKFALLGFALFDLTAVACSLSQLLTGCWSLSAKKVLVVPIGNQLLASFLALSSLALHLISNCSFKL